jgi:hypothetical protein
LRRNSIKRSQYQQRLVFLLLLALIAFALLVALAPLPGISFWGIDIYTFRSAAKAIMVGMDPYYEPNILRFADGVKVGNIHAYLYAPYFAFALRPLAWVSPEVASRLWFALNLLLYFASIGLLLAYLRWLPKGPAFLWLLIGLVLFPPLRTTLIIGQSTILLLFFFALSLFLLRQQRPLASGLVFSLGLFKPHLFPFLLFLALYRQWRWLAGVGVGLIVLNLPLASWLDDWLSTAAATRQANLALDQCFQMVSLVSLLNCTFFWPRELNLVLSGGLSAILLALVWWSTRKSQASLKEGEETFDRRLSIFTVLIVLLIDHTRIADQMLLLFPLLVAWRDWHWLQARLARQVAIFLTLFIYVLPYSLDIFGPRQIAFLLPFWYIALSMAVLGILLLEWRHYHEQSIFP